MNRRRFDRQTSDELVSICTEVRKDRIGLVRDISPTGMRIQSASRFTVGERVELQLRLPSLGRKIATGRVVRTLDTVDVESVFPHGAVIEFETPRFDLVEPLTTLTTDRVSALEVAKLI